MAQFTSRANLQLPGGGSSGLITPDEPADIDVLNENFRKIDSLLGAIPIPTLASIPSNAMDGQAFWVRDLQQLYVYDRNSGSGVPSTVLPPAGSMMIYAAEAAPTGWLLCRGQAISRSVYSTLFSAISTRFGGGNGSTTFNVPDMRGRVPVGVNTAEGEFNALNVAGGAKTHTLTQAQMPAHNHTQSAHSHSLSNHSHRIHGGNSGTNAIMRSSQATAAGQQSDRWAPWFGTGYNGIDNVRTNSTSGTIGNSTPAIQNRGGGGAHNNLQPYRSMNFIISIGR